MIGPMVPSQNSIITCTMSWPEYSHRQSDMPAGHLSLPAVTNQFNVISLQTSSPTLPSFTRHHLLSPRYTWPGKVQTYWPHLRHAPLFKLLSLSPWTTINDILFPGHAHVRNHFLLAIGVSTTTMRSVGTLSGPIEG